METKCCQIINRVSFLGGGGWQMLKHTYSCIPIVPCILHDLLWYSGRTELAPSGLATPILTGALEASAASDRQCTASHENWPRIRLGRETNNIYTYYTMEVINLWDENSSYLVLQS